MKVETMRAAYAARIRLRQTEGARTDESTTTTVETRAAGDGENTLGEHAHRAEIEFVRKRGVAYPPETTVRVREAVNETTVGIVRAARAARTRRKTVELNRANTMIARAACAPRMDWGATRMTCAEHAHPAPIGVIGEQRALEHLDPTGLT